MSYSLSGFQSGQCLFLVRFYPLWFGFSFVDIYLKFYKTMDDFPTIYAFSDEDLKFGEFCSFHLVQEEGEMYHLPLLWETSKHLVKNRVK